MITRRARTPRPLPGRRTRPGAVAMVAVTGGLLLAACGDGSAAEDVAADGETSTSVAPVDTVPEVPVTEIEVTAGGAAGEFSYTTDLTTIEAGRVRVRLTNEGTLDHQAMLLRIDDSTDLGGLLAAGGQGPGAFLGLVDGYGGPNAAGAGGGVATSTQDLEPGDYLLACIIPDANGVPHIAQGMFREFTVTEPATPAVAAPVPADGEVVLEDFGFTGNDEFAAGATVAVTNDGHQGHEIVAYPMQGDATIADVAAALADPAAGPPPIDLAGAGLGIVRPGGTATFRLPDRAGRYALVCFIPDVRGDLAPHFAHGMLREIVVS